MIKRFARLQLAHWVDHDLDDAQVAAAAAPPSSQRQVIAEALRQIVSGEATESRAVKMLGIVQAILAGPYLFFDEREAVRTFEELVTFVTAEASEEIEDSVLTVAALLIHSVRDPVKYLSDKGMDAIANALVHSTGRQKSVLEVVNKRIKAAAARSS